MRRKRGLRRAFIGRRRPIARARDTATNAWAVWKQTDIERLLIYRFRNGVMAGQTASRLQDRNFVCLTDSLLSLSTAVHLPPE